MIRFVGFAGKISISRDHVACMRFVAHFVAEFRSRKNCTDNSLRSNQSSQTANSQSVEGGQFQTKWFGSNCFVRFCSFSCQPNTHFPMPKWKSLLDLNWKESNDIGFKMHTDFVIVAHSSIERKICTFEWLRFSPNKKNRQTNNIYSDWMVWSWIKRNEYKKKNANNGSSTKINVTIVYYFPLIQLNIMRYVCVCVLLKFVVKSIVSIWQSHLFVYYWSIWGQARKKCQKSHPEKFRHWMLQNVKANKTK